MNTKLFEIGKQQFGVILNTPFAWEQQARHLLRSFLVLLQKSRSAFLRIQKLDGDVFDLAIQWNMRIEAIFLLSLAIENLLKGIWLKKNRQQKTDIFPKAITGHNLNNICRMLGIEVKGILEEQLHILTEYIKWYGRYPIPLKEDENGRFWGVIEMDEKKIIPKRKKPFITDELYNFIVLLLKEIQIK
jgi:hypothetical protein